MNKLRILAVCFGLYLAALGGLAASQGDQVHTFFLVGCGATVALIAAASAGPPRPRY